MLLRALLVALTLVRTQSLRLVFAGGTGGVGSALAERCAARGHSVDILCRNAFLAVTPSRVSEDFGFVGEDRKCRWEAEGLKIGFRDWTAGDELDSVSDRWVGWEDTVKGADAIVFAVGDLGRDGRRRPLEALARATLEAGDRAPKRFVMLSPEDGLIRDSFAAKKRETLKLCEARWTELFGAERAATLRAGTVLGLPRFADSRLFPPPKDLRRVRGPWVHIDDLAASVLAACEGASAPAPTVATLEAAAKKPARSNYYL